VQKHIPKIDIAVFLIIVSVSAMLMHGYFYRVGVPKIGRRMQLHKQIINGTAPFSYHYRTLVPLGAEFLIVRAMTFLPRTPYEKLFLGVYTIYEGMLLVFSLLMLFLWLHYWFPREQALVGLLFVTSVLPISLQEHSFHPWSFLEFGLFAAALNAMVCNRNRLLMLILAVAYLNKETALFIPLAYIVTKVDIRGLLKREPAYDWKPIMMSLLLLSECVLIFMTLQLVLGDVPRFAPFYAITNNLSEYNLFRLSKNSSLFLGFFWVFAVLGFRYAPPFIKRLSMIIPLFMMAVFIWGQWYEVRMMIPLYSILIPLGLFYVFRSERAGSGQAVEEKF